MNDAKDKDLSKRIAQMYQNDQVCRLKMVDAVNAKESTPHIQLIRDEMEQIDNQNLKAVKEIFAEYGYPTISKVGKEISTNFWLLVQHCDQEPDLQRSILRTMEAALATEDAEPRNFAYLQDRVLVNDGKLQIYGTQVELNEDQTSYVPKPVAAPFELDERRKSVGLEKIAIYTQSMNELYFNTLKGRQTF